MILRPISFCLILSLGVASFLTAGALADDQTANSQDAAAAETAHNAALLADRIESLALAMQPAVGQKPTPTYFRQVVAIYRAAAHLNPTESRYYRTIYEDLGALHDQKGQIDALNAYLQIPGNSDDRYAEMQLIDAYASRIETAEKKMAYLHGIIKETVLPASVRAHAAYLCALVLRDRAQDADAMKMLDNALQINPLDVQSMELKYVMTPDAAPVERIGLILAMLRANPRNADVATALAGLLAESGLINDSVGWYAEASQLYNATGKPRRPELVVGGAPELYLDGHGQEAIQLLESYLSAEPYDFQAWEIRLAIEKDIRHSPQDYDTLARLSVRALDNEFQTIRHDNLGVDEATTRPLDGASPPAAADLTLPDLSGDHALMVQKNDTHLADAYIRAAEDEAWIRLYFRQDTGPDTDRLLSAVAGLAGDDDPTVARLLGWKFFDQGKKAEASQKFSAVADRDPLAQLGLIELMAADPANQAAVAAKSKMLMGAHPAGPLAAVLFAALHQYGAAVVPQAHSDSVQGALDTFPMDWLNILAQPQKFYGINGDPVATDINFGEAIIARITMENFNDYDITIGDDAAITPQIVISGQFRGIDPPVTSAQVEHLWERTILPARQKSVQYVRLDRGVIANVLRAHPDQTFEIGFLITTNPMPTQTGIASGPDGIQVQFGSLVERSAALPNVTPDNITKLCYAANNGPAGAVRLSALDVCAILFSKLNSAQNQAAAAQQALTTLNNQLHTSIGDQDQSVGAWAQLLSALVADPNQQVQLVQNMINSPLWYVRFLGIYAATNLQDKDAAAAMLEALQLPAEQNSDVREYAAAASDVLAAQKAAAAAAVEQPSTPDGQTPPSTPGN